MVYFHIIAQGNADFVWQTSQILPLSEQDTFEDFISKINTYFSNILNDQKQWIDNKVGKDTIEQCQKCLKLHHKLKIGIFDKATTLNELPKIIKKIQNSVGILRNKNVCEQLDFSKIDQQCIYFVGNSKNNVKPNFIQHADPIDNIIDIKSDCNKIKKEENKNILTQNKNKNNKRKKRKQLVCNHTNYENEIKYQPPTKKRKVTKPHRCVKQSKDLYSEYVECLWLLVDASNALDATICINGQDISKYTLIQDFIKELIQQNWSMHQNKSLRLFSFSKNFQDLTNESYTYSKVVADLLLSQFDNIERTQNSITYCDAICHLINVIKKENVIDDRMKHRIILFTDGGRSRSENSSVTVTNIMNKLKRNKILFECIHATNPNSDRNNDKLRKLCGIDGTYWKLNSNTNSSLLKSDLLMHPKERNANAISNAEIIE